MDEDMEWMLYCDERDEAEYLERSRFEDEHGYDPVLGPEGHEDEEDEYYEPQETFGHLVANNLLGW